MKCFLSSEFDNDVNGNNKWKRIYLFEKFKIYTNEEYYTLVFRFENEIITECYLVYDLPFLIYKKINDRLNVNQDLKELNEMEMLIFLHEHKEKLERKLNHYKPMSQKNKFAKEYFLNYIKEMLGDK